MTPYIGEIRYFGGTFVPAGWQACDGSLLSISEYETLYTLLGTRYGGDGQSTFGVPDLRSRLPVGQGQGQSNYVVGQMGGSEQVTVLSQQMPQHSHGFVVQATAAATDQPTNAYLAQPADGGLTYLNPAGVTPVDTTLATDTIGISGGNQPHENRMPGLAARYIISLEGIYPTQS